MQAWLGLHLADSWRKIWSRSLTLGLSLTILRQTFLKDWQVHSLLCLLHTHHPALSSADLLHLAYVSSAGMHVGVRLALNALAVAAPLPKPQRKRRLGRWYSGYQRLRAQRRWEKGKWKAASSLKSQVHRHRKAVAKRADDIITLTKQDRKLVNPRGRGKWKSWLPDAVLRIAFSPAAATLESLARDLHAGHAHVANIKHMVSNFGWSLQHEPGRKSIEDWRGSMSSYISLA